MTTITLQAIEAKQSEINIMIAQLRATTQGARIEIPAATVQLRPGERYAGMALDDDGKPTHHLVVLPEFAEGIDFNEASDWVEEQGGDLPTRRELSLIFANCKPHLQPRYHWSCEAHESEASYAWLCGFYDGSQYCYHKSAKACAVAVRRITV